MWRRSASGTSAAPLEPGAMWILRQMSHARAAGALRQCYEAEPEALWLGSYRLLHALNGSRTIGYSSFHLLEPPSLQAA